MSLELVANIFFIMSFAWIMSGILVPDDRRKGK